MTRRLALAGTIALCLTAPAKACDPWVGVSCESSPEIAVAKPQRGRVRGVSLSGVVAPLASKARSIVAACGSKVVSAVRRTYIAGTRRISLHASGRAVDLQGNPACIYRMLVGWPGGVSHDYARVRHVHVSYDPDGRREWGLRFAHGRIGKRRARYAKRGRP